MKQTQKPRETEADQIAFEFYMWLGYRICETIEDKLILRKLVKKIERKAIRKYKLENTTWRINPYVEDE
jgi:hypothetical protein